MTEEFKQMVGAAIDAAAKAMKTHDQPVPVHLVEAIVGCTIQECALVAGRVAESVGRTNYSAAEGADDVARELFVISGVIRVVDVD